MLNLSHYEVCVLLKITRSVRCRMNHYLGSMGIILVYAKSEK